MLVPFLEVGLSKLSEFLHINMSDFDIPLKINIGVRAHTFEQWNTLFHMCKLKSQHRQKMEST